MALPGTTVTTNDQSAPRGVATALSTPFIVGELQKGPSTPTLINSYRDLTNACGVRNAMTQETHDWVDTYFQEGGGSAYVLPLLGASAAAASATFVDSVPATSFTAKAQQKGAWANGATGGLSMKITTVSATYTIGIYLNGVLVATSPTLSSIAAGVAWAAAGKYVTLTAGAGTIPVTTGSPTSLAGGDDDYDGITTTEITAAGLLALPRFGMLTGVLPGRTDAPSNVAFADALNLSYRERGVKVEIPLDTAADVAEAAADFRSSADADMFDLIVGRVNIPGLADGTTRTISLTAVRAGREAANETAGLSPNQPAAGQWGISQYATGLDHEWSDADRETLNDAGVNVAIIDDSNSVRLFGARTAVDPNADPAGVRLGSQRLRSAIVEIARVQGTSINFEEIDQGGVALANLDGKITAAVNAYQKSLYFLSVDAYLVEDDDTPGEYTVNVDITFQASPDAEQVSFTITRAVTQV